MVPEQAENVHVITRKKFDSEIRRHFVGEIKEVQRNQAEHYHF